VPVGGWDLRTIWCWWATLWTYLVFQETSYSLDLYTIRFVIVSALKLCRAFFETCIRWRNNWFGLARHGTEGRNVPFSPQKLESFAKRSSYSESAQKIGYTDHFLGQIQTHHFSSTFSMPTKNNKNKCENLRFKSECYVYFKKRKGRFTLFFILMFLWIYFLSFFTINLNHFILFVKKLSSFNPLINIEKKHINIVISN